MKATKFLIYTSSMMVLSLTAFFNAASMNGINNVVDAETIMEEVEEHHHTWSHDDAIALTEGGTLTGGNYYLSGDLKLDLNLTIKNTVNLCLNGYTLTGTGTGSVITINSGTLNLYDEEDGKITGGKSIGGGIYGAYGTLNMYGGTITGNTSVGSGGGVFVTNTFTFNMNGGKISDNEAGSHGGGVFVNGGSTFNMSCEAIITGNTTVGNGGGVYVNNSSSEFNLSGGKITNNIANCGGGVYVNDGPFKVSGNVNITDNNLGGNVYLKSDRVIEIIDQLDDETQIGVSLENDSGVFTFGLLDKGTKNNFFSDDIEKCIWENDDELKVSKHILSQPTYDGEDLHEPTCTENGLARLHCVNDCGYYENRSVEMLEHKYQYVEGKDATYTENGWKEHYYCDECGNYFLAKDGVIVDYDVDILIKARSHIYQYVDAKDPTCTEDGWREHYYCDECDNYFLAQDGVVVDYDNDIAIEAFGHTYNHVDAKNATCMEDGWEEHYYCDECGNYFLAQDGVIVDYNEDILIKACAHSYQYVEGKDATCTEDGWKEHYYCNECDNYFLTQDGVAIDYDNDIAIEAFGHTYSHVDAKNATCTEDGWKEYYYCGECDNYFLAQDGVVVDYNNDIVVDAHGHNFNTNWSASSDKHWHECSSCDNIFEESDHHWNDGEITKQPTKDETGEKEFICTECGYKKTEEIPVIGVELENQPTDVVCLVFFAVLLVSILITCIYMIYLVVSNKK